MASSRFVFAAAFCCVLLIEPVQTSAAVNSDSQTASVPPITPTQHDHIRDIKRMQDEKARLLAEIVNEPSIPGPTEPPAPPQACVSAENKRRLWFLVTVACVLLYLASFVLLCNNYHKQNVFCTAISNRTQCHAQDACYHASKPCVLPMSARWQLGMPIFGVLIALPLLALRFGLQLLGVVSKFVCSDST